MLQKNTPSYLTLGNRAMQQGDYAQAISSYAQVLSQQPELARFLEANLSIAVKKYKDSRKDISTLRVAVCGWSLGHNPAGRVYTLAQVYSRFAQVEIIGCLFPEFGREIWEPIRDTDIIKHTFVVEDEKKFLEQAIELVAKHPYDIVHLSKPRISNIFLGLLYKLLWGAQVFMDIDDEELAFVKADSPLVLDEYLDEHGQLPSFTNLTGQLWTRLAVGMVGAFDGITVCNAVLQEKYGGEIIRHARDERLFDISAEYKQQNRKKYGIAQDKKVVLFFGTPREHKGLIETAQAIAKLQRKDVLFVIVGDFPDAGLRKRIQAVKGCELMFFPNQPMSNAPEILSLADCCVFLQDSTALVSKYQTPAKLSDALAAGARVLAQPTPALQDLIDFGLLEPTCEEAIAGDLKAVIEVSNSHNVDLKPISLSVVSEQLFLFLEQKFNSGRNKKIYDLFKILLFKDNTVFSQKVNAIAFYLPQFYPTTTNDKNWGSGFTEWDNVIKANPSFTGHYQPKLPGELGLYDLRDKFVMNDQVRLAKHFGLYGFCFYYYRFGKNRELDQPLNTFTENKNLDFPFCTCWVNESWTRAWDGRSDQILLEQKYDKDTMEGYLSDLIAVIQDARYIKINSKPLVVIYQVSEIPEYEKVLHNIRHTIWQVLGLEILIGSVYTHSYKHEMMGFLDFIIQFPPHRIPRNGPIKNIGLEIIQPYQQDRQDFFKSYDDIINLSLNEKMLHPGLIPGVCPDWDNTARREKKATILIGSTPEKFQGWVAKASHLAWQRYKTNKQIAPFIFVNAWNEWAEGAMLEPTQKHGTAYLHALKVGIKSWEK